MPGDLLTSRQLNRATLARQMLLARTSMTPVEATQQLVGLQAQLPRPPFIGLRSRVDGLQRHEVVQGLLDKQLVRGTSLRGTLHMMTAADYVRFRAPLQAGLDAGVAMLGPRTDGADRSLLLDMGREFFRQPHTFEAFRVHVAAAFPGADARALAHTVRMQVPLLQVPTRTAWGFPASADFMTAEAWMGPVEENESATREDLVLRYLAAYGPATIADAQAWCGVGGLKPVFEGLRPRLVAFRGERGGELFDLPEAPRPPADVPAPVRLLPEWDNAIVSRADGRLLPPQYRSSVFRPGLRVLPTVLVDGIVAGTWKMERRGALTSVTVFLFGAQAPSVRREIEAEAGALLSFAEPDTTSTRVVIG